MHTVYLTDRNIHLAPYASGNVETYDLLPNERHQERILSQKVWKLAKQAPIDQCDDRALLDMQPDRY